MQKIFVDTAPIIYLVERNLEYVEPVSLFLSSLIESKAPIVTSAITAAEIYIKPIKLGRLDLVDEFEDILNSFFEVLPITWEIAELSASLRSKYPSLKAFDAIQVACAIGHDCQLFFTNDRRLKFIKEVPIQLVRDL